MVFKNTPSLPKEPVQMASWGLPSSLLQSIPQCGTTESPQHTCRASRSAGIEQIVVAEDRRLLGSGLKCCQQDGGVFQVAIRLRNLGQEAILEN
jgi:hypothetical protein